MNLLCGLMQAAGVVLLVVAASMVAVPFGVAVAGLSLFAVGAYVEHR